MGAGVRAEIRQVIRRGPHGAMYPRDYRDISELDARCFPGEDLPDTDGEWWVARVDGAPVAYACMDASPSTPGIGVLWRAGVLPRWRRRGLHSRLLRARESAARRHGWGHVVTYVAKWNLSSANSLLRRGYLLYEPKTKWGLEDALYLYKRLGPAGGK